MADSNPHHRISLHQLLGGGSVADVLLWRKWCGGVLLLVSSTTLWFLFERGGYNLLSFVANVLLLLVVILFFWAKSASLLNRPLPPLPDMEISEETIVKVADAMRMYINYALSIARGIAIGRNLKLFLKVAFGLWVASYIGSFFNFLTLVYVGVLLSLSVPVLYDKYQDHIDERLCVMHRVIQTQYRKIDESLLKKIPIPMMKEKKIQVSSSSESVVSGIKMGVQHMKLLRFLFAGMLLVLMSNASYSGNPLGAGLTPIASTFGRTFNFLFFVFLGETHIIDKYWSAAFKSFLLYFTCSFPLDDPPMLEGMLTSGNGNQIYISLVFSSQCAFCVFVAMPIQPPGKAVTFLVS